MRHKKRTKRLVRNVGHRNALLMNLALSLLDKGKIKTTKVRAKEASRLVDRLVTLGKTGTVAARRRALAVLRSRSAVKNLFDNIAPLFTKRAGGYTRVLKLGARRGDGAELAVLELTEWHKAEETKTSKKTSKPKKTVKEKDTDTSKEKPKTSKPAVKKPLSGKGGKKRTNRKDAQKPFMKNIKGMFKGKKEGE